MPSCNRPLVRLETRLQPAIGGCQFDPDVVHVFLRKSDAHRREIANNVEVRTMRGRRSVFNPTDLDDDSSVIFAVDQNLRILYCNKAWDSFAEANGASGLSRENVRGRCVLDDVPQVLRPFYEEGWISVFSSNEPWEHTYQCSSPENYREFHMRVLPLQDRSGLIVINSLSLEQTIPEQAGPKPDVFSGPDGLVTMCAHCRRARRLNSAEPLWDWVPEFVRRPPSRCSHGLCGTCLRYYYPGYGQQGRAKDVTK